MSRLAEVLATFDPGLPLARARTLAGAFYTEPVVAEAERRAIFGEAWQCVGREEQVAEPGQYLTVEVAGEPIVVVRGDDRVLRAFSNVCRHRAARVMPDACGRATKLRCRYHGWTYDLAGRLRGGPAWDGVEDFRREDHGLPPVAVDTWGPLVFVSLAPEPAPLPSLFAEIEPPQGVVFHARREYELACNWKVFVDNYLDGGYHVNTLHPALAGALDYGGYHTVVHDRSSTQVSPLRTDSAISGVRRGDAALYHWIWPNLMINVYEGVMDTNVVFPVGVERCRVLFDFYFAEGTPAESIERSIAVAHQVQLEDEQICGEVQRGLASRSYQAGRFSVRRENGGLHFHRLLHARLSALLVLLALALVACKKESAKEETKQEAPAKKEAPAKLSDPSCADVAEHFADYLSPTRNEAVWPDTVANTLSLCEYNDFSIEERRCWMEIRDAPSHQKCLDLRVSLGRPPMTLEPEEGGDEEELEELLDEE